MQLRIVAGAAVALALSTSSVVAHAQASSGQVVPPGRMVPRPVTPPPPPSFESSLASGASIVARWNLPTDASNNRVVLAQVRSAQGDASCVFSALVGNAWVTHSFEQLPQDAETPHGCLDARKVANRWVLFHWSLGGSENATTRRQVDESSVEIFSLVGGRFARVYSGAVTANAPRSLASADPAALNLEVAARRSITLVWSADGATLVERPATRRRR